MARQTTTAVSFNRSTRQDTAVLMTSGRAGVVQPACYIPLLAGDSCSGRVGLDFALKEMPKPLLNGASVNIQAWFVPKSSHPQFAGRDEFNHARTGENIKALGQPDRTPPPFFTNLTGANQTTAAASQFFKRLGIHIPPGSAINTDLVDAFNVVYNFRLAAHSSRLTRKQYSYESVANACALPPAFWPSSRFKHVVPDYERALVVGSLDLDVAAGRLPVSGIGYVGNSAAATTGTVAVRDTDPTVSSYFRNQTTNIDEVRIRTSGATFATARPEIFAEMAGQSVGITLNDIDKARTTQAFAKLRTAYAGNDATGFDNDDTLVALLMQGIELEADDFKRPWLLDNQRVPVGFVERFATDGASLDASVSLGRASATLNLNVPKQDVGGVIIVTVELLPERIDERMTDEWLQTSNFDQLPNALRDVQRIEPVDIVLNRRLDAKHSSPNQAYGYEPMNYVWNRDFTRLGGDFYQPVAGSGWTENRSAIWQTEIVNPAFNSTHFLAPAPFPHSVFADTNADAYELVVRHAVTIAGITQIGDVLAEANDDYEAVQEA